MSSISRKSGAAGEWIANIGLILLLVTIILPFLKVEPLIWHTLYAVAAGILLIARIFFTDYSAPDMRARRLKRMTLWSALFFAAGCVFAWFPSTAPVEWLAFFLAGGVLQAYSSLALPAAMRQK